jgi:hypothetical protein
MEASVFETNSLRDSGMICFSGAMDYSRDISLGNHSKLYRICSFASDSLSLLNDDDDNRQKNRKKKRKNRNHSVTRVEV